MIALDKTRLIGRLPTLDFRLRPRRGALARGGPGEEDLGRGRCESMGALQNTSLYFEAPAKVLFARPTAERLHWVSRSPAPVPLRT